MSSLTSEELTVELKKLHTRLAEQRDVRHGANEELNATILELTLQQERHAARLDTIEGTIKMSLQPLISLSTDIKDIKVRLIGDPSLRSEGLIQEHSQVKLTLEKLEKVVTENKDQIKNLKRERVIVVSVLGGIGTVVAFLKSTALIKWLSNS